MLREFEAEQANASPFQSALLTPAGRTAFPDLMRQAIRDGNEDTLKTSLAAPGVLSESEEYVRDGVTRTRRVNIPQAAERLSLSEFNTWYVRGLTAILRAEKVATCQVYRAAQPKWEPADCQDHEGLVVPVDQVYLGHRARYWPPPGNPSAFSVPFGPNCHHTVRRVMS